LQNREFKCANGLHDELPDPAELLRLSEENPEAALAALAALGGVETSVLRRP
jgi:hypothetical protein